MTKINIMETFILLPSTRKNKRYMVKTENKTIHFGSINHENFTIHKDIERKERYLKRHSKNEDWTDPLTAGFWSRWLLWTKPNLNESIKYIKKEFNIQVLNKL